MNRAEVNEGKLLGGKYRLIDELGRGAMGIVWLAYHPDLDKRVAIKCLPSKLADEPELIERFRQEARNQGRIATPNIVNTYDFFEDNGQYYLVMEYVDGEDLGKIIRTDGKISVKSALRLLKDVLRGLSGAHKHGIVHRDIKPSNIIVDKEGVPKLADFGIALAAGETRLTRSGNSAIGTSYYMSPEQIRSPRAVTARSDIYSVGIVLYEMLTGKVPYDGASDYEIEDKHVHEPPPDPRKLVASLSKSVAKLVLKATAKKPEDRYASCEEYILAVDEVRKEFEDNPSSAWKRILVGLVVAAAVAGGAMIYRLNRNVDVIKEGDSTRELEKAKLYLQAATERAALICRDIKQLAPKRRNMEIAESIQDTALVDAYKKQLLEIESNIEEGNKIYLDAANNLSKVDAKAVRDAFTQLKADLESKQLFDQVLRLTSVVIPHYEDLMHGIKSETQINIDACAPR